MNFKVKGMLAALILIALIATVGAFLMLTRAASSNFIYLSPSGGKYTVYAEGSETVYFDAPIFAPTNADAERWDFTSDGLTVDDILSAYNAKIVAEETVGGASLIYAYSPLLTKSVMLSVGKVNLMAAFGNCTAVGYPVLGGSY